jgi:hypothetical protein
MVNNFIILNIVFCIPSLTFETFQRALINAYLKYFNLYCECWQYILICSSCTMHFLAIFVSGAHLQPSTKPCIPQPAALHLRKAEQSIFRQQSKSSWRSPHAAPTCWFLDFLWHKPQALCSSVRQKPSLFYIEAYAGPTCSQDWLQDIYSHFISPGSKSASRLDTC